MTNWLSVVFYSWVLNSEDLKPLGSNPVRARVPLRAVLSVSEIYSGLILH